MTHFPSKLKIHATRKPTATMAEEESKTYDWSAHYDDEGQLYYYNEVTDQSSWEAPAEGFNPPEPAPQVKEEPTAMDETTTTEEEEKEAPKAVGSWAAYKDEDGREYYSNAETGETQWDKPEGVEVAEAEEEEEKEEGEEEQQQQPEPALETADSFEPVSPKEDVLMEEAPKEEEEEQDEAEVEEKKEEPKIDPAVQRLQDAEKALTQPDSILEPECMKNVTEVVTAERGNPQKAISALIESFQGQTAICGLLGHWLGEIRAPTEASSSDKVKAKNVPSQAAADEIREVAQNVVYTIAKQRFSKAAGDSILDLSKSEAAFLEDMMDSPRWRRLLIDLSASHKDSAVLVYCLRAISKRGHHREIAKRINQSDHFAVFNAMLLSELTVIGKVAMSAGSDSLSANGLIELTDDLRRASSSTSYTYLYSVEMIRYLVGKLRRDINPAMGDRFGCVLRKWEALSQELESTMMDPLASSSEAGSSPLFRKRRLEVALTVSELHQRQRKRQRNTEHESNGGENGKLLITLENALLRFLRKYSTGIQIDDSTLDALLPQGLDLGTAPITGKLLIEHPLAIRALLGYLYKPGSTRVTSPVLKNKCSRMIALAVMAAEVAAREEKNEDTQEQENGSDEVALTRMILQGSQLCEDLENMISFVVTETDSKSLSPGQKLVSLAFQCAAVAQGVVVWARELTHGPEFASSASFPTLSVSILSLVRIVTLKQAFTRRDALEVGLNMLRHSNGDISYLKLNAIKEQGLRLLLFLLVEGEMAPVLSSITNRLQATSSDLDASLVRYFVGGILEVVRPPVSFSFCRSFCALLQAPKCIDAVRSTYFGEPHKQRLIDLLKSFRELKAMNGSALHKDEAIIISSILTAYQVS
jgi:hypothetical protein